MTINGLDEALSRLGTARIERDLANITYRRVADEVTDLINGAGVASMSDHDLVATWAASGDLSPRLDDELQRRLPLSLVARRTWSPHCDNLTIDIPVQEVRRDPARVATGIVETKARFGDPDTRMTVDAETSRSSRVVFYVYAHSTVDEVLACLT